MKVYALYRGRIFEGGSVINIYSSKVKAVRAALILLRKERKACERVKEEDTWEEAVNTNDFIIKIWQSDLDEIIIYEYQVK